MKNKWEDDNPYRYHPLNSSQPLRK